MSHWQYVGYALVCVICMYLGYRFLRNPQQRRQSFSKENLLKSLNTLGVLALILIVIIVVCVYMLRMGS